MKVLLIIPYFGKWPLWFEATLVSIAKNPTVNWLCPTDCEIPTKHPKNITFLPLTLQDLNHHVNEIVDVKVPLTARKFCDLKPAYADIFSEHICEYDFWGFCDMDIIWGDIRKFITSDILKKYDIISSRKENISGHFNLFRNTPQINTLYKEIPEYKKLYEVPELKRTDEVVLSNFIKTNAKFKDLNLKVLWSEILCNQERGRDSHQEYYLDTWLWKDGKMLKLEKGQAIDEVMYLHFINWKRTFRYSEIRYQEQPKQFYISYSGIHYRTHTRLQKFWNKFKNSYDGYYMILKRKALLKRTRKQLTKLFNI